MKTFLFQGDSITDAGRERENDVNRGYGYPTLVSAHYLKNRPYEFNFINRGISGNRVVDLYARARKDIVNLNPDYMSILIGVNDVWHELADKNGVEDDRYEIVYNMLIDYVKEQCPDIKIFILEPFVLKGPATADKWDIFRTEVEKRARAARRVAERNNLVFIPLQEAFDKAAADGNTEYWLCDGVHPTAAGHQIIMDEMIKGINI